MRYDVYEVCGRPIPLARHRHVGKVVYDPQSAVKRAVRDMFRSIYKDIVKVDKPIKLFLEYHMKIPKSYHKKKAREIIHKPHSIKPDLSNLIKFTEDVFNDVIWRDDSLVCEIEAKKLWALEGKTTISVMSEWAEWDEDER